MRLTLARFEWESTSCLQGPKVLEIRRALEKKGKQLRMDRVLAVGAMSGAELAACRDREMLLDGSIRHNATSTSIAVQKSHEVIGAAATKGVADKLEHYEGAYTPSAQTFVPFVTESYGALSDPSQDILEQVATHAASEVP